MDPISGSLLLKAAIPAAQGLAGFGQAKAEKKKAEINAFIGRTRAIQTDSEARRGLDSELGSMRNVMAANQQSPSVGTFEVMQELRDTRDRERRINVGNRNTEAAGYRMDAKAAGGRAFGALAGGAVRARQSLFDLDEHWRSG